MFAQAPEPLRTMTEADYLAFEQDSELRHEFVNGNVYAMTGGSVRHNIICQNISTTLDNQLEDSDCFVTANETRVKVDSTVSYRYPDVTVICGDVAYFDNRVDTVLNPIVLVEVASPSTVFTDRNAKLDEYMAIESVQEYVLVAQHEPKVERYLRQSDGNWLYTKATGLSGKLALPSIGCQLDLTRVYKKLDLISDNEQFRKDE